MKEIKICAECGEYINLKKDDFTKKGAAYYCALCDQDDGDLRNKDFFEENEEENE
jgi:hypothetical protein